MMTRREKLQYLYVFAVNLIALAISMLLGWLLVDGVLHRMPAFRSVDIRFAFSLLLLAFLITFFTFDQSQNITQRSLTQEIKLSIKFNLLLTLINAAALALTKAAMLESRYYLVAVPLINMAMMVIGHRSLKAYLMTSSKAKEGIQTLVGVITTRDRAPAMIRELREDWTRCVTGVALLEVPPVEVKGEIEGVEIRANYDNFMEWLRQAALDEVYVDIPMDSGSSFVPILKEMESMGLTVHFGLPMLDHIEKACCDETSAARLSSCLTRCAGREMVTMETIELRLRDQILKRALDLVGGIVGCIISIPIIAIVAIPLKLESPGPLVFRQQRVGRNGRTFYIHKLRSMYVDAEQRKKDLMAKNEMNGLMFKITDDPRITKVGKFIRKTSIDELPQFFDVVRGDMSLVGTRPPTLDEYKRYESHHKRRLSMKPGITGLWQVSGRSDIEDFEDVVRLDVQYIDNWTIWNDVRILLKTVYVVFAGQGAK